jgi:zinc D-Ala-D-Ala carboxypeptidase
MMLSTHFSLAEFLQSQAATRFSINNSPPDSVLPALIKTALGLEGIRTLLGVPIIVTSGYRSTAVNHAVGGAVDSQHTLGQAVDFIAPGYGSPLQVARTIVASKLTFDQLIMEGSWLHVSFTSKPRKQVLTAHFDGGKARYTEGLA